MDDVSDSEYLANAIRGDSIDDARAEIDGLCHDFIVLARQYQATPVDNIVARERLVSAMFHASHAVHDAQMKWILKGVDVFVAHDRNGSPIRVDRISRGPVIGWI